MGEGLPRDCTTPRCELYPYRLGRNPYRQPRELTDEQRQAAAARFAAARGKAQKPI
jgi:ribosomal protein S7